MATLEDVIPIQDFPKALTAWGRDPHWALSDNAREYRKNGGHRVYGPRDIAYRPNRYGYRAPDFAARGSIRVVTIGDETALGIGLPEDHTFGALLAERMRAEIGVSVVHWNLSSANASGDYIARVLHLAVPLLTPTVAFVMYPALGRREFMTAHGHIVAYVPGVEPPDAVSRDIYRHFDVVASTHDDQFTFYRNYKAIEVALRKCEWLLGVHDPEELTLARPQVDPGRLIDHDGSVIDAARHPAHAGPRTHERIAESYWNKLESTGALQRLSRDSRRHRALDLDATRVLE